MKKLAIDLKTPAFISILLVLPFLILELVNRRPYPEDFPLDLFGILWLIGLVICLLVGSGVQRASTGEKIASRPLQLLVRVSGVVFLTIVWVGMIVDQMPCFLGVPICD